MTTIVCHGRQLLADRACTWSDGDDVTHRTHETKVFVYDLGAKRSMMVAGAGEESAILSFLHRLLTDVRGEVAFDELLALDEGSTWALSKQAEVGDIAETQILVLAWRRGPQRSSWVPACWYFEPSGHGIRRKRGETIVLGSGASTALAALDAGASPLRAMKIACERHPETGSGIDVFEATTKGVSHRLVRQVWSDSVDTEI